MTALLLVHAPFMNGPNYWKWPWRRLTWWRYFPLMALCAAPLFAALFIHHARTVAAIALVMLSMLAMQIVHIGLTVTPFSLSRITYFVESPMSTSYFADAIRSMDVPVSDLIANYPGYMPQFYMHSQEKPPGPILFFRTILSIFGTRDIDRTALIAGLITGVLATLTVPATYLLIRAVLNDRNAAFAGCALIALCPGLTLHFPMLDQLYPIFTCALIGTWVMAMRTGKRSWAVAFGATLAAACFVVYHFLVLGALLGAATVAFVAQWRGERIRSVTQSVVIALGTLAGIYLLLDLVIGFNATAVFRTALVEQGKHLSSLVRPYPRTILFDLTDFALGAAWIPWILALMGLPNREAASDTRLWSALCIAQILLLALLGLMQAETARIWCFLLPVLILPAAAELSRWPRKAQLALFAAMWMLLCLVGQNLTFMY
jgi:hypothetical protein